LKWFCWVVDNNFFCIQQRQKQSLKRLGSGNWSTKTNPCGLGAYHFSNSSTTNTLSLTHTFSRSHTITPFINSLFTSLISLSVCVWIMMNCLFTCWQFISKKTAFWNFQRRIYWILQESHSWYERTPSLHTFQSGRWCWFYCASLHSPRNSSHFVRTTSTRCQTLRQTCVHFWQIRGYPSQVLEFHQRYCGFGRFTTQRLQRNVTGSHLHHHSHISKWKSLIFCWISFVHLLIMTILKFLMFEIDLFLNCTAT
jgi:hypothetical protein